MEIFKVLLIVCATFSYSLQYPANNYLSENELSSNFGGKNI